MPINPANTCILCHKHDIHSDSDGSIHRRTIELRQSLTNVLARSNEGRENLSQAIEEKFGSDKFVLQNKIGYLSLRSMEKRREMIALIKRIEKRKIKIAELSVERQKKLVALRTLVEERARREELLCAQRAIYESITLNNKSFLFQMLHACRWRAVVGSFLKFQIVVETPLRRSKDPSLTKAVELTGCSTILGLPFPNSGDHRDVPPQVVSSVLAHCCHLVDSIASLLAIRLPHPVGPFAGIEYALISPHGNLSRHVALTPSFPLPSDPPAPRSSFPPLKSPGEKDRGGAEELLEVLGAVSPTSTRLSSRQWDDGSAGLSSAPKSLFVPRSARRNKAKKKKRAGGGQVEEGQSESGGKAQDSTSSSPEEEYIENPEFAFGLSLLHANVLSLCIKAGQFHPSELWPPEALLPNLALLQTRSVEILTRGVSGRRTGSLGKDRQTEEDATTAAQTPASLAPWLALATESQNLSRRLPLSALSSTASSSSPLADLVHPRDWRQLQHKYAKSFRSGDSDGEEVVVTLRRGVEGEGDGEDEDEEELHQFNLILSSASSSSSAVSAPYWSGGGRLSERLSPTVIAQQEGDRGDADDSEWAIVDNDYM